MMLIIVPAACDEMPPPVNTPYLRSTTAPLALSAIGPQPVPPASFCTVTLLACVPSTLNVPDTSILAPLAKLSVVPAATVTVTPAGIVTAALMRVVPDHVVLLWIVPSIPSPVGGGGGGSSMCSSPSSPTGSSLPTV